MDEPNQTDDPAAAPADTEAPAAAPPPADAPAQPSADTDGPVAQRSPGFRRALLRRLPPIAVERELKLNEVQLRQDLAPLLALDADALLREIEPLAPKRRSS